MELKVGDRLTLTGGDWNDTYTAGLMTGDAVTIQGVDADGAFRFVGFEEDGWWDVAMEGWEVELNRDTPAEHLEKLGIATPPDAEERAHVRELLGVSPFEQSVRHHTNKIADLLISKNKQYANSALDPIRVFSKADRMEQLRVRADDKLSRIRNGDTSEDALTDLAGYIILMKIAEESA